MNVRDEDPARWRDSSADPRALTARAADLVDAVRGVSPLPPEALARIETGVHARRPARGAPLVMRLALMAGFVLASVATARGTMILWRRFAAPPARVETKNPKTPRHVAVKVAPIVEELPEKLDEAEPVAPPVVAAPMRAHKSAAPARQASDEALEAPASTAKDEAELLARAISRLRQARDPGGALALLDQYQRSFPHGVMEPEALRARLEAVIQMDDRKTALALLDERRAFAGRLGAELLLTRAPSCARARAATPTPSATSTPSSGPRARPTSRAARSTAARSRSATWAATRARAPISRRTRAASPTESSRPRTRAC